MQLKRHILVCISILLLSAIHLPVAAQLGYNLAIKKPKPYENRILGAEKPQKKFKIPRHILQNTATHYNYYFNANNKINEVIQRAKESHVDDYSILLSFYNYSLETTAQDKAQLDSVIYKAQTGIVLHDLRNDYIDNLYLLWGAAYYYQQQWDSAYQMFQFVNYSFANKEKDGYYKYIGSKMDGNSANSIATPEKKNFFKSLISDQPSRNMAFVWQVRTLTEANRFSEAGNLLQTLRNDPAFPERLRNSLEEAQAYWFYKQEIWDSSATHLVNALDNAPNIQERSRWEYLVGQLFEKSGKLELADDYYTKSIGHTTDPIMDIYARLNLIRINKEGGDNYIDKNIADLLKMAKRDKYRDYRDVIYFMAAQMEMARNNPMAAQEYVLKGAKYNNNNLLSRNQTYLQLADLLFVQKKYRPASFFYDSLQADNLKPAEAERVSFRKEVLAKLTGNMDVVIRQDSLQRIAALPEKERTAYIKKLVRQLRYQQGLKDEAIAPVAGNLGGNRGANGEIANGTAATTNAAADPFRAQAKGEWYFYSTNLRTQGATTFKQVWGNRPNMDNWRRGSDVAAELRNNNPNATRGVPGAAPDVTSVPTQNALLNNLPLTPELLTASNDSIQNALYAAAHVYADELEDYPSAIETYEELRRRFPNFSSMSDVLFQLYHAYNKAGEQPKAAAMKKMLTDKDPTGRYTTILQTGKDPESKRPVNEVTKAYEHVYDLFIEGRFDEALTEKRVADDMYHTNYWSPQLLYIEAVYYARQRDDSTAIQTLNTLISQSPDSALVLKASTLIDVLSRRKEIEEELTNLQIERPKEDSIRAVSPPVVRQPITPPVDSVQKEPEDTIAALPTTAAKIGSVNTSNPRPIKKDNPANFNTITGKELTVKTPEVKKSPVVTVPPASDTAAKKVAAVVKNKAASDTATAKKTASVTTPPANPKTYTYTPDVPHYAVIVLNKVDIVFGNEARNAFNRYNREKYYSQPLDIQLIDVDGDNKLLLVGNFTNAQGAIDYVQQAKQLAPIQIVPWLKGDKYSFSIISNANLELLKAKPDMNTYKNFLEKNLPVKF